MSAALLTYRLCLAVRSPFLFRGLAAGVYGVDATALRDSLGRAIIPADQVRGLFKDTLRELPETLIERMSGLSVDTLFGKESASEATAKTQNLPNRRRIHFADLTDTCPILKSNKPYHTRVEIHDTQGVVKTGALQLLELTAPMGKVVYFTGDVQVVADENRADDIQSLLQKVLPLLGSIGSIKSSGFGEVIEDQSTLTLTSSQPLHNPPLQPVSSWPYGERLRLRVTFDRPVLFDSTHLADNATASAAIIPGAAFKGALADRLQHASGVLPEAGDIATALSQMHFSHAFPIDNQARPLSEALPQSLVAAQDGMDVIFGDAINAPTNQGAMIGQGAALFVSDWKGDWYSRARDLLGWSDQQPPATLARTHTAINAESRSAAEGKLFTTHLQGVTDHAGTPFPWQIDIDLGRVPVGAPRAIAQHLVMMLLNDGLYGMGGTGASARFKIAAGTIAPPALPSASRLCLRLRTPAVLFHANDAWPSQGKEVAPFEVYKAYFARYAPGATLCASFAQQRFAGGYQARRRRAYGDFYFPFVVTEPGAVFLLDCPDQESRRAVADLVRWGLTPWPYHDKDMTWQTCPFMPENGYGALAVEDLDHPARAALIGSVSYV
jgi:hypothetical protein